MNPFQIFAAFGIGAFSAAVIPFLSIVFKIGIIFVLGLLAIKLGNNVIKKIFARSHKLSSSPSAATLIPLSKNILKYIVYFIMLVTLLKTIFGIDTTTLIATAGIGGLAIGFGAQALVKDIISGFFLLLEGSFIVGDIVAIGAVEGKVIELGLRTTRIVSADGTINTIPNGEIKVISKRNQA